MENSKFEELKVWQRAQKLAVLIYQVTNQDAFSRDYGLRDQIRRSAVSISSNIAEGDERDSDADSVRFLFIAKGSLAELRTQLKIAHEIGYMDEPGFEQLNTECVEVSKMLWGLINARRKDLNNRR